MIALFGYVPYKIYVELMKLAITHIKNSKILLIIQNQMIHKIQLK